MKLSNASEIPIITGPTAVGKTSLTLLLARRLNAEIISCDSRQVFRGLDIGTAKPSVEEQAEIRHHFIDESDLDDPFSAGIFARAAEDRIESVHNRGFQSIVTGGSTLYLKALISGLAEIPDTDPGVRAALNERLKTEGADALYKELCTVDLAFAKTLDPTKSQRIIRGLEVFYGTGSPLSKYFSNPSAPRYRYKLIVLNRDRSTLYDRINSRVVQMVESGLVDEVQELHRAGVDENTNALRTIGYREVFAHIRGEYGKEEMIDLIQRNTRRYAKRQLTWFRALPDATWIDLDQNTDLETVRLMVTILAT